MGMREIWREVLNTKEIEEILRADCEDIDRLESLLEGLNGFIRTGSETGDQLDACYALTYQAEATEELYAHPKKHLTDAGITGKIMPGKTGNKGEPNEHKQLNLTLENPDGPIKVTLYLYKPGYTPGQKPTEQASPEPAE